MFLFATAFRLSLEPTQPPIQWVPGGRFLGVKRPGRVKLTTHLHPLPTLRMLRSLPPLLHTSSWRRA